jgi:RIO kinase 2
MKLDVEQLRYLSRDDFRVLTALEQGMKNHDVVPTELVAAISGLRSGASKVLANLTRHKLISHECGAYEGYRLTYPGYDFLALRTLLLRGVLAGVGGQIGMGKESDIYLGSAPDGTTLALKFQRLGRTSFRAVLRTRDYTAGRRKVGWLYLSRLATSKEFAFMQVSGARRTLGRACGLTRSEIARDLVVLYKVPPLLPPPLFFQALSDASFPVPTPVACNRHLLVMSLAPGRTLSLHRYMPNTATAGAVFDYLMGIKLRLAAAGIVHCDFNEFNVLLDFPRREIDGGEDENDDGIAMGALARSAVVGADAYQGPMPRNGELAPFIVTLIDFPQMVSISHPHARELFERDVLSLRLYFSRRFGFTPGRWPTFEAALSAAEDARLAGTTDPSTAGLDVACEASGYVRNLNGADSRTVTLLAAKFAAALSLGSAAADTEEQLSSALASASGGQNFVGDAEIEGNIHTSVIENREELAESAAGGCSDVAEDSKTDAAAIVLLQLPDTVNSSESAAAEEAGDRDPSVFDREETEESQVTVNRGWRSGLIENDTESDDDDDDDDDDGDAGSGLEDSVSGSSDSDVASVDESVHEAFLLAQRPPIARSRPNGRRVRDSARGGEAYLSKRREAVEAAAIAVGGKIEGRDNSGPIDRAAIVARTRMEIERARRRKELSSAAARAGKGRGAMKDREKQKAREASKVGADANSGW